MGRTGWPVRSFQSLFFVAETLWIAGRHRRPLGALLPFAGKLASDAFEKRARGLAMRGADQRGVGMDPFEPAGLPRLDEVDLVEDEKARQAGEIELLEHAYHRAFVLVPRRIAGVDHVQEQVGVGSLLEGRTERREQIFRQLANEPDGA